MWVLISWFCKFIMRCIIQVCIHTHTHTLKHMWTNSFLFERGQSIQDCFWTPRSRRSYKIPSVCLSVCLYVCMYVCMYVGMSRKSTLSIFWRLAPTIFFKLGALEGDINTYRMVKVPCWLMHWLPLFGPFLGQILPKNWHFVNFLKNCSYDFFFNLE